MTTPGVLKALDRQAALVDAERERREAAKKRAEEKAAARKAKLEAKKAKLAAEEAAKAAAAGGSSAAGDDGVVELGADGGFDLDSDTAAASTTAEPAAPAPAPASGESAADATGGAGGGSGGADGDGASDKSGDDEEEDDGPPLEGNGGVTDRYKWTQTLQEVTISFFVPHGTRGRDCIVDVSPTKVKVGLKGQKPFVDAKWHKRVKGNDDFTWTLETDDTDGRKVLSLYVTKEYQMEWWNKIAEGEPEVNTKKVQPENSKLTDLDAETRQTVEKMMFDQRAKAMGQPTSDERQKQAMLDKFMKAHPEMDFSKAKIN